MFCSKCGKQIKDDAKFCNYCGAVQPTEKDPACDPEINENQQEVAEGPANEPTQNPKKKANILIVIVVALCAFLIGKFVIAPSFTSDSDKKDGTSSRSDQSQTENNKPSADENNLSYDAVFDGTYIVHFQAFFNMETKSFASKEDDGTIFCSDYGYEGDVVKQYVETMYFPISGYSEEQKSETEAAMKTRLAYLEALDCCTVTYKMSANYFIVTCEYSEVDKAENYGDLYSAELINKNASISMSETEASLLSQGFVKK